MRDSSPAKLGRMVGAKMVEDLKKDTPELTDDGFSQYDDFAGTSQLSIPSE